MSNPNRLHRHRPNDKLRCYACLMRINLVTSAALNSFFIDQKYFKPLQKATSAQLLMPLIVQQKANPCWKQYKETLKVMDRKERVHHYYSFRETVGTIKAVVLDRVKKDKYVPINFNGPSFNMWTRYYYRKANTRANYRLKFDKDNGSGHSTDQEHKPTTAPKPTPVENTPMPRKQSDNASMRRLTRNLSHMVRKFDISLNSGSIIYDLMNAVPGHEYEPTTKENHNQFKRELEDNNISAIKPKRTSVEPENHYGFVERKRPLQPRLANRLQEDRRGSYCYQPKLSKDDYMRVQTEYNCDEIRRRKVKSRMSRQSKDKPLKLKGSLSSKKEGSSVSRSRMVLRRG